LFHPTTQRVPATPDLWRDGHDRRRLIGVFMLVFKNHPNRAGADLGRKPVCSVTFSIGSINTYFGASGKQGAVQTGLDRRIGLGLPTSSMT
jgi:hypothetical protein